jgi:non-ribosomal peptide synthetase component F
MSSAPAGISVGPDGWLVRDPDLVDPLDFFERPERPVPDAWTEQPLIVRFDALAAADPDRVLCSDGTTSLTFGEVARCVAGFGAALDADPVDPALPVAIVLHDGMDFLPFVLTLFASGRIFTVIDAGHPVERQQALVGEVRPGLVVSSASTPIDPDLIPPGARHLVLDRKAPGPGEPVRPGIDMDAPAGLIFTSGSTGRPKGVAASQRAYLEYLQEYANAHRIGLDDVLLSVATLSAAGARECLAAAFTGAQVRIMDFKSVGLAGAMAALGEATILTFIPSVMRAIATAPGLGEACSHLRVLNLLSEPLLTSDVVQLRRVLPPTCRISLEFGATELTSAFRWYVHDEALDGAVCPSGYIVPGQEILLAAEDGSPVPFGEIGELVVRSRRVARGLWAQGELTPGRFGRAETDPAVRVYATGDLMRLRPDSLFEFVGRRDRMIKIRGLQVDLAEVEAAMRTFPGVADAVALPIAREGEPATLQGFIVADQTVDIPELRRFVTAETAAHMSPAKIVRLAEIPRLAGHKPDLVRLEALARA